MRFMTFPSVIGLVAVLGACSDPTAPADEPADVVMAASANDATTVTSDSHWETWPLGTFFLCDGSVVQNGTYDVHLQITFINRADGSADVRYHINAARARGTGSNGVEYVLVQAGNGAQWYTAAGSYTGTEAQNFRLLSPGHDANLLLTYRVTIQGDGVNLPVVTFELVKNRCVG